MIEFFEDVQKEYVFDYDYFVKEHTDKILNGDKCLLKQNDLIWIP